MPVPAVGGSLESIANAKAGIMKAGRPVVLSSQPEPAAEAVLLQHAEELGCEAVHASSALQLLPQASQQGLAAQMAKGQWQKPFDRRFTSIPFGEDFGRQLHLAACDNLCFAGAWHNSCLTLSLGLCSELNCCWPCFEPVAG